MNIEDLNKKALDIHNAYEEQDCETAEKLLDGLTYSFLESIALGKCESPSRMSNLLISLYDRKMGYA